MVTGVVHTREIPITEDELNAWLESNAFVQDFFPRLSANDREFLITGITPEEWGEFLGPEEEDEL